MTALTYNVSMGLGVALIAVGLGLVHLPSGLIALGVMIVALTLLGARLAQRG